MCGIAGIAVLQDGPSPDPDRLLAMCGTIEHRGPDDEGKDIRDRVGLGMRRLSIIDLEGGQQPYFNEDRTVRAVFNGEIYNFRELRSELQGRGHHFASLTDGEVIVHLWEEYGTRFADHLNGMFAIALHDAAQGCLVLVRDRLGIKPLYYALPRGHLVFGSEVKTVLASELVERRIDLDAVGQFLAWEYVPAPRTPLKGVFKLDAAEMMVVDLYQGRPEIRSWWDLPPAESGLIGNGAPTRPEEWEEAVDDKLRQCVRRQLVSDVPLGAFLSGGVDSSLVVAAMGEASTFSIGFDDPTYNELSWSKTVAEHLGVGHETKVIEAKVVDLFEHLMQFMDDPIGDFSIFPTYLVSQHAAEHVKVVLTGDGGDELFGGYETYLAQAKERWWRRVPSVLREGVVEPLVSSLAPRPEKKGFINKARRFVEGLQHETGLGHARWRLFVGDALRQTLFSVDALEQMEVSTSQHILKLFARAGNRSELDRCLYVDLKSYLSDNCLVKVDRMSMACSLEARVPFLDHELVELAFRMPSELKLRGGQTKPLLKRVAARHIPRGCVYRPKQGFSIPVKNWLRTDFRPLMEDLLHPRRLAAEAVFDVPTIERLKKEHLEGRENHSHTLWALMVFEDWRRRWVS